MWTKHSLQYFFFSKDHKQVFCSPLYLIPLTHVKLQHNPKNDLLSELHPLAENPFTTETRCLLNSVRKIRLKMDTLNSKLNFIWPEDFSALSGRNVVFSKYYNDILKQFQWLSGKSLYCRVGRLNLNSSSPWVAAFGFLCQNKAPGFAGEEFIV